eukprot:GFKZ01001647.1.p2 GENE.GFKZ01001647.1~~GFKZ01001647.1.p2  ORF type:complete len:155 (-),score=2.09 GFKZ01001647.1:1390-1854(-)
MGFPRNYFQKFDLVGSVENRPACCAVGGKLTNYIELQLLAAAWLLCGLAVAARGTDKQGCWWLDSEHSAVKNSTVQRTAVYCSVPAVDCTGAVVQYTIVSRQNDRCACFDLPPSTKGVEIDAQSARRCCSEAAATTPSHHPPPLSREKEPLPRH